MVKYDPKERLMSAKVSMYAKSRTQYIHSRLLFGGRGVGVLEKGKKIVWALVSNTGITIYYS